MYNENGVPLATISKSYTIPTNVLISVVYSNWTNWHVTSTQRRPTAQPLMPKEL
jgi:hypothetical protein